MILATSQPRSCSYDNCVCSSVLITGVAVIHKPLWHTIKPMRGAEMKWIQLGRRLTSDLTHRIAVNILAWQVIRYRLHLLCGGLQSENPSGDMFHARHEVLLVICGAINCSSQWLVSWDKYCAWTAGTEFLVWNKTATFGHVSKNEHFGISSLLMLRAHYLLNYLLAVPGGWTLLLAAETSEYQWRKAVSRSGLEQGALAWVWRCLSHPFVYATGLLYVSLKRLSYGGNKYHVIFLLAMNAVCCTWWDLLGSAFPGAEVSAPERRKTRNPAKRVLLWWELLLLWNKCCLNRKYSQPMHFSCAESPSSSSVQRLNAIS